MASLNAKLQDLSTLIDEFKADQQNELTLIKQQLQDQGSNLQKQQLNFQEFSQILDQSSLKQQIEKLQQEITDIHIKLSENVQKVVGIDHELQELSLSQNQINSEIAQSKIKLTNETNEVFVQLQGNLQNYLKLEQEVAQLKEDIVDGQNQILTKGAEDLHLSEAQKIYLDQKQEIDELKLKLQSLQDASDGIQQLNHDGVVNIKNEIDLIKQWKLEISKQFQVAHEQQEIQKIHQQIQELEQQIIERNNLQTLREQQSEQTHANGQFNVKIGEQEIENLDLQIKQIINDQNTQKDVLNSLKIQIEQHGAVHKQFQQNIQEKNKEFQEELNKLNDQISDQKDKIISQQSSQEQFNKLLTLFKEQILHKLNKNNSQVQEAVPTLVTSITEVLKLIQNQQQFNYEQIRHLLINKQNYFYVRSKQNDTTKQDMSQSHNSLRINQSLQKINDYLQQFQYKPQFEHNAERQTKISQIIQEIYENSWKKRHIEYKYRFFVRDVEQQGELQKNYSIRTSASKSKLREICSSFRQARGDGNCFYTAFGYQFLLILLTEYSDQQFGKFIDEMKKINLPMKLNGQQIQISDPNQEQQLLEEFLYRLEKLRLIPESERENKFTEQFAAYEEQSEEIDGIFYGLSTIFFRNLANYVVDFSEMKEALFDRENLLIWEQECNSNEIVIEALAKYLKIRLQLVFFDNGGLEVKEYFQDKIHKIILLIKPGHYSIGIKNKNEQLTFESFITFIQAEIKSLLESNSINEKDVKEEQCAEQLKQNQNDPTAEFIEKLEEQTVQQQNLIIQKIEESLQILIQKQNEHENDNNQLNQNITKEEQLIKLETHIQVLELKQEQIQQDIKFQNQKCTQNIEELKGFVQFQQKLIQQQIDNVQMINKQNEIQSQNQQSQIINENTLKLSLKKEETQQQHNDGKQNESQDKPKQSLLKQELQEENLTQQYETQEEVQHQQDKQQENNVLQNSEEQNLQQSQSQQIQQTGNQFNNQLQSNQEENENTNQKQQIVEQDVANNEEKPSQAEQQLEQQDPEDENIY